MTGSLVPNQGQVTRVPASQLLTVIILGLFQGQGPHKSPHSGLFWVHFSELVHNFGLADNVGPSGWSLGGTVRIQLPCGLL